MPGNYNPLRYRSAGQNVITKIPNITLTHSDAIRVLSDVISNTYTRESSRILMRQTRVGVPAARHGEVGRVSVALSDLRGDRELVVALRHLREGMMTRQGPGLGVQLHRRESLDERIAGRVMDQPNAVVMRRQRRMRRHRGVNLRRHKGVPRHGTAAAGGPAAHVRRGHAVRRVRQRHRRAVRISDDRLRGIVRQSRGRGLYADVVVFGERGHPHVGGPAERFLVRVQRIRELRSRELATNYDRRLVRILEDDRRAADADLVAGGVAERRHVVHVLRRGEGLAGTGAATRRRESRARRRWLGATLKRTAAPLLARFLARLPGQVVHACRPTLGAAVAGVARVTRITVHAARRLAVAAGVAVSGHRAGPAAVTATHSVQGRRVRRVRARCQFVMRHP